MFFLFSLAWFTAAFALMAAGVATFGSPESFILLGSGGAATVAGGTVLVIVKLYVKTSASMAYFRTGWGTPLVIIDGGAVVVPVAHELTPVLLQTMKLEVVRKGAEALICKDFLRVDVAAEFYIRVDKTIDGVKAAATTLGRDAMNPEAIKSRFMEKLVSSLRTVAATMDLNELHQNRDAFGNAVQLAVTKDIEPNGLILETVTISQLDQTDIKNLKPENVFDAQGLRKATEITQQQAIQKNKIDRTAELAITQENVATRKKVLDQEQDRSFAEADQSAAVKNRQVQREREKAEYELSQQEEVEKRSVHKEQAVKTADIQREAALLEESQKRETTEVKKMEAIEVAEREKSVAVSLAEARRAEAQAAQRLAEAKEREAGEKVITAAEVEVARREKQKAVIRAEQDGEQQLIEQQKKADAEAYTKTRQAQAVREAAENEAQARIRLAEAELEARRHEAAGQRAIQMVPVEVDAKRVEIEAQRVEVLRKELEAKEDHSKAAIQLEIAKLQIDASKEVGMAMAHSIGQFMSQGQFQVFGDPQTLSAMTSKFADGLGLTQVLVGLKEGNPLLGSLVDGGLEAAKAGLDAAKAKAAEAAAASRAPKTPVQPPRA